MKETRIALVQMQSETGRVDANLKKMAGFIEEAAGQKADMICFPELCIPGYSHEQSLVRAETVPGYSTAYLGELARKSGMIVLAGLAEESGQELPFISQLVIFPDGSLQTYRKTHLGRSELGCYSPGDSLPVFSAAKAGFGVEICWDLHFPEVSTILALKGSEIIFAPHASPRIVGNRREIWLKYLPARAYDNAVFVAACNLIGSDGAEKQFCGGAMVIDPRGRVIAEAFHDREELLVVDLDPSMINQIRREQGRGMSTGFFLKSRRPELYRELIEMKQ